MRRITFIIEEKDNKRQIRDFLRSFGISASLLTRLKQTENGIMLNGRQEKAIAVLNTGDKLEISIESKGEMPEPSGENRKPILRKYCVRRYTISLTMKPLLLYIFVHFPIPQRARHQDMRKGLSGHCPKDMCNQQKASGECHSEIQ